VLLAWVLLFGGPVLAGALMPRAGWALHWLYPGQHLLAAVAYHHELTASVRAGGYGCIGLKSRGGR
jgi:hypothetical protein